MYLSQVCALTESMMDELTEHDLGGPRNQLWPFNYIPFSGLILISSTCPQMSRLWTWDRPFQGTSLFHYKASTELGIKEICNVLMSHLVDWYFLLQLNHFPINCSSHRHPVAIIKKDPSSCSNILFCCDLSSSLLTEIEERSVSDWAPW